MKICGLQKMSMVDYPGKLAATVFTGGCNLRCPFCHNAILVTEVDENEVIPEKEVFEFLKSRQGLLDGVVISGGEPLLYDNITNFAESVKELNFTVKLDTNGFFPEKLNKLLSCGNIDYVAMDIKNSKDKYSMTTGIPDIDISPVEESVEIIKNSNVEYEFRTTLVREFHQISDVKKIGEWLNGAENYYLQTFVDSGHLICDGLHGFNSDETMAFKDAAVPFFGKVEIRGQ